MLFKETFKITWILLIFSCSFIQDIHASCASFEFQCLDGRCIPKSWLCDGTPDCREQEDETHHHCDKHKHTNSSCFGNQPDCMHQGHFRCIRHEWLCDGHLDCDDGQDEANCSSIVTFLGSCGVAEHQCASGGCVPRDHLCDGKFDCMDGSDESGESCGRDRTMILSTGIAVQNPEKTESTVNDSVNINKASKIKMITSPLPATELRTQPTASSISTPTKVPEPLTLSTITQSPLLFFENPLFSLFGVTPRPPGVPQPVPTTSTPKPSAVPRAIVFKASPPVVFPTLITSGTPWTLLRTSETTHAKDSKLESTSSTSSEHPTMFPLLKPLENVIVGIFGSQKKLGTTPKAQEPLEIRRAPAKDIGNSISNYEMMETTRADVSATLRSSNGSSSLSKLESSNTVTDTKELRTNRAKVFRQEITSGSIEDGDMLNFTAAESPPGAPPVSRPVRYVKGVPIKPYKIRYEVKSLEKVHQD